ncbi:hypothetical protein DFJ73DRAFT_817257 [Zopfochytrium polystomum]|nr:hypothetical protein DFJ73DRAFT_817257 [Zopfochytrium polystomum]
MDLGAGGAGTGDGSGADTAADEALARRLASTGVAETDEELARRLQQEAQDEELARRLAAGDQQPPPTLPPRPSNGGDVLPSYNAVAAAPSAAAPLVQPPPIPARPVAIVPFVHRKLTIRPGPNLRSYLVHEGVQLLYQLETPATMRYGWDAHLFSNQLNAVTLTTRRDLNQKGFNVFNPLAAHTHTIVTRKAKFPRFVYSFLGFDGMYYSWEDTSLFRVMGNYKLTVAFLHGGLLSLSRQLEIFTEGLHMVDLILATYFGRLILERDQP